MKKYRKKPVVIEAIQFDGTNAHKIQALIGGRCSVHYEAGNNKKVLAISTLEGTMTVSLNDWVIKGIKGEFYPCKPDIFAASYDEEEVSV